MANTYYDSQLTAEEIETVLEAVDGLIVPTNNGKIIAIENGTLAAKSVTEYGGGATLITKSITQNGTYNASSDNADGYSSVTVNVSGGASGIHFGSSRPPETSLGINGEYYYQRDKSFRSIKSFSSYLGGSNAIAFGIEFTVSQNTTVTHLCSRATENRTGKLQIGTTSEILAEIENVSFPAGEWVEKELDSPIQLVPGVNYVVRAVVDSTFATGSLAYARSASYVTYSSIVTNVRGRYTSDGSVWPGSTESNSGCLTCFRYLSSDGLYRISSQFYKSSGTWTEIT